MKQRKGDHCISPYVRRIENPMGKTPKTYREVYEYLYRMSKDFIIESGMPKDMASRRANIYTTL